MEKASRPGKEALGRRCVGERMRKKMRKSEGRDGMGEAREKHRREPKEGLVEALGSIGKPGRSSGG